MMPAFSTTTANDIVVASILLMGATQKYFVFHCVLRCGIPSVTLLGEKRDWEKILRRLEKLKTFGEEPTQFYTLLKPVVKRLIQGFEDPTSDEVISFWQRIAHYTEGGSGPSYYSGWITAFCFLGLAWRLQITVRANISRLFSIRMTTIIVGSVRGTEMRSGRTRSAQS